MLERHHAIDLIYLRLIQTGGQILECRPTMNRVLLLGKVQEQGTADAVPHHSEGHTRELPARHKSAHFQPTHFTPAHPVTNILFLRAISVAGDG